MKRILAAIDFLDTTDRVINYAKKVIKETKGKLLIVHSETLESYLSTITTEFNQTPSMELINAQKEQIEDRLNKILDSLNEDGIKAEFILMEGSTVENILREADIFKADLIVIGSHKHGKFHNLLFGSIHKSLIALSQIPVLIVPSEDM
ncbi:MAG: universal stress protein [Candidatus Tenebribacter burtonii]|jgi:nucleotide-binding universal stress UspA family protein|nr:universal stress protein [Candidatus Tenebribacter burtonii]